MQADVAKRIDRGLYFGLSLWMWVIIAIGFWPSYVAPGLEGTLDKTGTVHLHVLVYIGWMILFTIQSTLPMVRRTRLHRKLGRYGIGYAGLVFVMGLVVSFEAFFRVVGDGALDIEGRRALLNPLNDMMVFPVLFGLAIGYRRNPEIHKRLMVLAGTMLLIAAVFRMTFLDGNLLLVDLIWLSPIWLAIAHDAVFRRRLHPVYGFGLPLMALVPARNLLVDAPFWRAFTEWLVATFR
jgi:hypothetical protein